MDAQALYLRLGRVVAALPPLTAAADRELPKEVDEWLAELHALVNASGDTGAATTIRRHTTGLTSSFPTQRQDSARIITSIARRALASAELSAPQPSQGAFLPAGNAFDAFAAVAKVLGGAAEGLLVVDPYMDAKALTDFVPLAPEGVTVRLLADGHHVKPTLKPATERWAQQYGSSRPLEARLAPPRSLHDRLIVVDQRTAWVLTQSFNALATRAPAAIVRAEDEVAALKIAAYADIWMNAAPI